MTLPENDLFLTTRAMSDCKNAHALCLAASLSHLPLRQDHSYDYTNFGFYFGVSMANETPASAKDTTVCRLPPKTAEATAIVVKATETTAVHTMSLNRPIYSADALVRVRPLRRDDESRTDVPLSAMSFRAFAYVIPVARATSTTDMPDV